MTHILNPFIEPARAAHTQAGTALENLIQSIEQAARTPQPLWTGLPKWTGTHFTHLYGVSVPENRLDGDGKSDGARVKELNRRLALLKQWRVFNCAAVWLNMKEVGAGIPALLAEQHGLALIADSASAVPFDVLPEWAELMDVQGAIAFLIDDASAKDPAFVRKVADTIRDNSKLPVLGSMAVYTDRAKYSFLNGFIPQFYRKDTRARDAEKLDNAAAATMSTFLKAFPAKNVHTEACKEGTKTTLADEYAGMFNALQIGGVAGYLTYGWDDATDWSAPENTALRQAVIGCGLDYWHAWR